jgi:uncharacterized protein (DUF488 family)
MAGLGPILTIGHSRHSLERFIALLEGAGATAIADVRSAPVSHFSPHFNKAALAAALAARGIDYIFLGRELGGRPEQKAMYTQAWPTMRRWPPPGIARLAEAAEQSRVAAMCSEADSLDCHRCLLVARALAGEGVEISHVLASGEVVTHAAVEDQLLQLAGRTEASLLLSSRDERLAEAYRARARKVAYAEPR